MSKGGLLARRLILYQSIVHDETLSVLMMVREEAQLRLAQEYRHLFVLGRQLQSWLRPATKI